MTAESTTSEYPQQWEADVVLGDGRTAHLRPITPDDADRLVAFHARLSDETVYLRFFAPYPELSERDVHRFTHVDHDARVALVATVGGDIIGIGRYDRIDPAEAEVAFTVRDDHQGRGVGSVLLEHLAAAARERGIERFVAEVLPSNRRMLATFEEAGYVPNQHFEDGVVSLSFDIEPNERSREVMFAREHRAEARSIESLLNPRSVAVVGASRTPGRLGHELLRHVRDAGFTGPVYAVHPEAEEILGYPCLRRVADAEEPVDLAVLAVPAERVLGVVQECAAAGVRGLVVVSGGFAESGPEGRERQRALVAAAHANGMRVVGPNALGLINTDPRSRLNASLSPLMPSRGRLGFFCQSGALGTTILGMVHDRGLGLSTFVSAGNRADVSANDLLQYWRDDDGTDLVLLYLESIGNPRKFARIARHLARRKPIVAVRSGRTSQALPLGHAVRRTGLPPSAVDALFAQSGVIQTDDLDQLLDVASILAFQPLPRGPRVAVVGNSDALGVLAADACAAAGLEVTGPTVNLPPDVEADACGRAVAAAAADPVVDALLVLHVPPLRSDVSAYRDMIVATSARLTAPVVAVLVGPEDQGSLIVAPGPHGEAGPGSVPVFSTVEAAVRALGSVVRYADWRHRVPGEVPDLADVATDEARDLVEALLDGLHDGDEVEPSAADTARLLAAYGIDLWPSLPVSDVDAAVEAGRTVGYPAAIKTTVPSLAHRTDLGGVRLNIDNDAEMRSSFSSMTAQLPAAAAANLVVQRMAQPGVACVVRSVEDPLFGPVVSFGVGGAVTELLADRAYRIPPISDAGARDLVREPGAAPLLLGHGGADPVDTAALEDLLARVGRLADDLPEVAELEINPVVVGSQGLAVLAARVRLAEPGARTDAGLRRRLASTA